MTDVSMMPNLYLTKREALGFHLVNDHSQAEARLLSSIEELLGFHLGSDQGQAKARLLSLSKELLGFHLIRD